MQLIKTYLVACVLALGITAIVAPVANAQDSEDSGTTIAFGNRKQDTDAPIDVTSEKLAIDETANTALFTGDVVVVQGTMTLYAPWVKVFYNEAQDGISNMRAKGGVTLIQNEEAAEGEEAVYDLEKEVMVMTGDVLVTQKLSAIAADKMTIKMDDGTALMTGRVKTLLRTSTNKKKDDDG